MRGRQGVLSGVVALQIAWLLAAAALAEPPSRALDPTAPGLPTVRGGWDEPPVETPPEAAWSVATIGAARLHDAIGLLGDGDLPGAIRSLNELSLGADEAGHRQEALYYTGVALERAGLVLLAGRSLAAALQGDDQAIAALSLDRLEKLEDVLPGAVLILDLPVDAAAVPLTAGIKARLDLARAADLIRTGRREEALSLLATIPDEGDLGSRARVQRASLLLDTDPEQAMDTLVAPGQESSGLVKLSAARLEYSRGKIEIALELFREIDRASPWFPEASVGAAWALRRLGRPEEALSALLTLASGEHGEVPAGGYALAAHIYLEACEEARALALVDEADRRLSRNLELLSYAVGEEGKSRLAELAADPDTDLVRLLLQPGDEWLAGLLSEIEAEKGSLMDREEGSPLAPTPLASALVADLDRLSGELSTRVAAGLGRRAVQEREISARWLSIALGLRHELLERQKEEARKALASGMRPGSGEEEGGWSFGDKQWVDPLVEQGGIGFGGCAVGKARAPEEGPGAREGPAQQFR